MYAVILAGGGGTRLWPLSRPERPKPFLPLLDSSTLLQRTVARLPPLIEPADVYVVTDRRYLGLAREQLPDVPERNLIGEPEGRNTAAAAALAAVAVERPADEVMAVLPADHQVHDEVGFRDALATAERLAAGGLLVTLGIEPSGPETGYGYILATDRGAPEEGAGATVERFVEKPDRTAALELLATRRAYWNAGIFLWRRDALLGGLERHASDILGPIRQGLEDGSPMESFYPAVRATSIDYALLEPASMEGKVAVVPMSVGWSDLGNWAALLDALAATAGEPAEGGRNVVTLGAGLDLGSEDVLVHSSAGRLVVTIGLRGTIVVDTPDAVLVCARERAQDVKSVVERVAAAEEAKEP